MIATVRIIGLLNAAVWLGSGFFAVFGAQRAVASKAMEALLTARHFPYFSGVIGQLLSERFWHLHIACALIALLHFAAESLYFGKGMRKGWLMLLLGLLLVGVLQEGLIQPSIKRLHLRAYAVNRTVTERQTAASALSTWRGVSGTLGIVVILSLGVYLWRVANPPNSTRFISPGKYRG